MVKRARYREYSMFQEINDTGLEGANKEKT